MKLPLLQNSMGFRYQKRVNLGKGLGLNISKSGISPSLRTKYGAIGTRGSSIRTPISGLTYRTGKGDGLILGSALLIGVTTWLLSKVFKRLPPWACIPVALIVNGLLAHEPTVLRVLVVGIILAAGVLGWVGKEKQRAFTATGWDWPRIQSLSWSEFEEGVTEAFRMKGFAVKRIGGNGPDGGVDIELRQDSELFLVQCKHWNDKVGVRPVRELYGVIAAKGASGGFMVCSGGFTEDAVDFARTTGLHLLGPEKILNLFQGAGDETR